MLLVMLKKSLAGYVETVEKEGLLACCEGLGVARAGIA